MPNFQPLSLNRKARHALTNGNVKPVSPIEGIRELFKDEDSFGAVLLSAASRLFAANKLPFDEWTAFDPAAIYMELQDYLGAAEFDEDVFARLMASVAIVSTDLFYQNLRSFIEICNILAGSPGMVGTYDAADVYEMAWGVAESQFMDPETKPGENAFSDEIRGYMGFMLQEEGFLSPPGILSMAVMPTGRAPAELGLDGDLTAAVISGSGSRVEDLEGMLVDNTKALVMQLEAIVGPLNRS